MSDEAIKAQIRSARGKFAAMAATYSLGVFNDNFFKQAAMLLAVAIGYHEFQGYATIVFTLPYILFAAPAGWLADRFSKGRVVIIAKLLELAAMICGAIGIVTLSWPMILAMVFTMGLQSAMFSPALNGSIPELYPPSYVTKANSIMKVVVTVMILGGVATAGVVLELQGRAFANVPFGRWAVAGSVLVAATLGVIGSFGVPQRPAASPAARFPWVGPRDTIRQLMHIRSDSLLAITVCADTFIWFIGSLQILIINKMGVDQFKFNKTQTSILVASELIGFALGGLLAGRISKGRRWYNVLSPAAFAMVVLTAQVGFVPYLSSNAYFGVLVAILILLGTAGGVFMIPCESFIQVRPKAKRKGRVIAAANFAIFCGILLTGLVANVLNEYILPTNSFLIMSILTLIAGVWLMRVLRRENELA